MANLRGYSQDDATNKLQNVAKRYLNRPYFGANDFDQARSRVFNDPNFDLDRALNEIMQEGSTQQAETAFRPEMNRINDDTEDLVQQIQKASQRSQAGMEERGNQLGLLRSGLTAAGMGDIQQNQVKDITRVQRDKADRLAELALRRTGYATDLYNKGVDQNFQNEARATDAAMKLPKKTKFNVPGLGTIEGAMPEGQNAELALKIFQNPFMFNQLPPTVQDYFFDILGIQ